MDEFNQNSDNKENKESLNIEAMQNTVTENSANNQTEQNNQVEKSEDNIENNIPKICINKKTVEPGKPFGEQELPKIEPVAPQNSQMAQNTQQIPPYNPQQYNQQIPPQYNPQQPGQYNQQTPYNQQPYDMPPYNPQQYGQQVPPPYAPPHNPQTPPLYQPYQQYGQQSPYKGPETPQLNPEEIQMQKKASKAGLIVFCVLVSVFVIGFIIFAYINSNKTDNASSSSIISSNDTKDKTTTKSSDNKVVINIPIQDKPELDDEYYVDKEKGLYTTVGVNERVAPSVVGIECYSDSKLYPVSGGSGIILSDDGYIITNSHVVEGMKMFKVVLNDDTEYKAELIGNDKKTDLAVLKITAKNLTVADFGNSDQIKIGEQVAVIGNPGVFSNTVSFGYVSAVNRKLDDFQNGIDLKCIQTDAAVNPGNSGGPLVNMYGQVIGIVSSKYVSEGYENIGFAISINEAIPVVEDIMSQGYITDRVRLGIQYSSLSQSDADSLDVVPGLLVREIDPDCDVANSGLMVDDIIVSIDDINVYDAQSVKKAFEGKKPGDEVELYVYRVNIGGEAEKLTIKTTLMQDTSLS